jgi:protein disulfide-isomerase
MTISGEAIRPSRTSILETLSKITSNPSSIPAKSTTGRVSRFFLSLSHFGSNHPILAIGLALGLIVAASLFGKSRMRRRGFGSASSLFPLGEKDGLLGGIGSGNGAKHD